MRWRASYQSARESYTFLRDGETEEASLDYGELDRRARAVAARLQGRGVGEGERVLLAYHPGLEYVAAFLGCLYAGVIAVPAYPPRRNRSGGRLSAIAKDSGAMVALTTTDVLSNLEHRLAQEPELKPLRWFATDDGEEDPAAGWSSAEIGGDTVAFLQYTSGSTATPKGVMVSHDNLMHNLAMIYHGLGHTPESRMVSWLPPYHDMGLIAGALQPLYGGFPVTLMPPVAFLQRPLRWLRAISRLGADSAGAPNFAYDLCSHKITPEERETLDLSSWTTAFSGAEPVRRETLERFAATFTPCGFRKRSFYPAYGLAEATIFVTGGSKAAPPVLLPVEGKELEQGRASMASEGDEGSRTLVGCGQTLADQRVVVVDPQSLTRRPHDRVGEIWVSGSSVARGYWGRPEETARTFQAYLADSGDGPFLRTGDLGFVRDGELFVTGRLKDLIIFRGRNHYPQDIEQTVEESHGALRPGCCAAFSVETDEGEQVVVVQELERSHARTVDVDEVFASVRRAVAEQHELQIHAVVLIRTGSIFKTTSGKIQRQATKAAYLNDALTVVAEDVRPAVAEEQGLRPRDPAANFGGADRILAIVTSFLRRRGRSEPVRLGDSLQGDLGLDSLAVAEMVIEVEMAFEVQMGDSVIAELRTVEDICDVVRRGLESDTQDSSASAGLAGLQDRLFQQIPQLGATVDEQEGRDIKIGGRWYCDFASANYLGLDLHPDVLASIPDAVRRWGVHPSWTRAVASPRIYDDLEQEIARFIRAPHVLAFPTISLLHTGVLPVLAGNDGVILLDRAAHNSIQEAAQLAGARGTTVDWFDHNDPDDLGQRLELYRDRSRKVIAVDGVYSMSGAYPPLPRIVRLARRYGARVYVDDAHGFGVIGENPTPENPYGDRGNGVVRYFGLRHSDDIVYVGGLSKAFSSMVAFVTCADEPEKRLLSTASTSVFSGPCPTASLATALAGLKISRSDEGSAIRRQLLKLTGQLVAGARSLGFEVDNNGLFPLVTVKIGAVADVVKACNVLWEHGILITPALFPAVPIDRGALRFTITAANTEGQVRQAIEALRKTRKELVRDRKE